MRLRRAAGSGALVNHRVRESFDRGRIMEEVRGKVNQLFK
jgi:hypothetical protein